MPKNEFDPEDPMELCGVGLLTEEDTSESMTECFIEEFLRLGYNAKQILALFRNPHYTGMNMVMQNRGEQFVKDKIVEVFGWWKRPVSWAERRTGILPVSAQRASGVPPEDPTSLRTSAVEDGCMHEQSGSEESALPAGRRQHVPVEDTREACTTLTDPMGDEIPSLD